MSAEKSIEALGWVLESEEFVNENRGTLDRCFRAKQRGFFTMWRSSPEYVLADIRRLKERPGRPVEAVSSPASEVFHSRLV